ncbi:Flp family type IVb pilin [Zhengella sp. ZM62]|uniref:Flp family type IVb pilin n=1 Tax=Zhengella sedimenti TaxID=3390035 RepID=UPI00397643AB
MRAIRHCMKRLAVERSAATSIEYGLVSALAGLWLMVTLGGLGIDLRGGLQLVSALLQQDDEGGPGAIVLVLE